MLNNIYFFHLRTLEKNLSSHHEIWEPFISCLKIWDFKRKSIGMYLFLFSILSLESIIAQNQSWCEHLLVTCITISTASNTIQSRSIALSSPKKLYTKSKSGICVNIWTSGAALRFWHGTCDRSHPTKYNVCS